MRTNPILIAFLGLAILPCAGQTSGGGSKADSTVNHRFDFGLTFTEKFAKITDTSGTTFNMPGASIDVAYNFKKYNRLAIAADIQGETATKPVTLNYGLDQISFVAGPRYTVWRQKSINVNRSANIYFQGLFGGVHAWNSFFMNAHNAPTTAASSWAIQAGGGMNLPLSRQFGLRVMEIDYIRTALPNSENNSQTDVRFSSGVTFHAGKEPPPPIDLACSASPSTVFPGDPVMVASNASGLDSRLNAIYFFTGPGVTGSGAMATVATGSLAPGTYAVNCGVKQGKAGKEGLEHSQSATANTSFTVRAYDPPSINCAVNPSSIKPGETANIIAVATSPQNRPLSYSYMASSGAVSGGGASAEYSSSGASIGPAEITCSVKDDKGQTASANTSVTVLAPPPVVVAPAPEIAILERELAVHSIYFPTAKPSVTNPEDGLLASQQDVLAKLAGTFQRYLTYKTSAHLVLGGHADPRGTAEYNNALTERRVNRAKSFLVERGVPAGSIEVQAFGKDDELSTGQVKQLIEENPELNTAERKRMLDKLPVIVLANNRRVDVTLSTTGQQSTRLYPFNAKDALALIGSQSAAKQAVATKKEPAAIAKPKK